MNRWHVITASIETRWPGLIIVDAYMDGERFAQGTFTKVAEANDFISELLTGFMAQQAGEENPGAPHPT